MLVIGDFQMDQRNLMLKVSLKSFTQDYIEECVSGTKHFYWVPLNGIRSLFMTFLCIHEILVTKASNDMIFRVSSIDD